MVVCSEEGCGAEAKVRGMCKRCYQRAYMASYMPIYNRTTKARRARKLWSKRHPAHVQTHNRKRYAKRPEQYWARSLRKYGLTPETYKKLLEKQKGVCAICGKKPGKNRLAVDHCHVTNRVRGLLCSNCNTGLGSFKDSLEALEAAARYLATVGIRLVEGSLAG